MAEGKTIDLSEAGDKLESAQEELKQAGAAMQACFKAWRAISGPSPAKRGMWKAAVQAREAFYSACEAEGRHFGVMLTIAGQGDLFNGEGEDSQGGPRKPDGPKRGGPKKPPGNAVIPFSGATN